LPTIFAHTHIFESRSKYPLFMIYAWLNTIWSLQELLQGGTRLLWGSGDMLRLLSKLRIWGPLKPLVTFINALFPVQQNVQITYALYKAVTNIIS
jgi:hypothetical protein